MFIKIIKIMQDLKCLLVGSLNAQLSGSIALSVKFVLSAVKITTIYFNKGKHQSEN